MRRKYLLKTSLVAFLIGGAGFAQTFEVATVKLSAPLVGIPGRGAAMATGPKGGPGTNDPGRWTCTGCNFATLLVEAYQVKRYQLVIPGSIDGEHYDIAAKVPAGATKEQFRLMIQNLLAERFKLTFHHDHKEMAVYDLVVAKGGPKLVEHVEDASQGTAAAVEPDLARMRASRELDKNGFPIVPKGCKACTMMVDGKARLVAMDATLEGFANMLMLRVGKPVFDATGLKGKYDISVTFDGSGMMPMRGRGGDNSADPTGAPPIEDAIQAQLGLKLESKKGNVEMFVVDHAEKIPTEN